MSIVIEPRIIEILADLAELPPAEVNAHRTLDDLGLDSLHLTELAVKAQMEFGVTLVEGELYAEQTVAQVVDHLRAAV